MKITHVILAAALSAAALPTAMRADDLSDLVAAVANTRHEVSPATDILTARLDTMPRYVPHEKETDIDMLDGIYEAMTVRSQLDFLLSALSYTERGNHGLQPAYDYISDSPTLGRGDFYRPVPGAITSRFGWRPQFQRMHHGVDLRLHVGDTVRAAVSGTVQMVSYDHKGYGNYVVMTHPDGMETLYGHLQYALVGQGQHVEKGRPIGIGGNTGNSTGPHLHFEARLGGVAVDPTLIFDFYGRYRRQTPSLTDNTASAHSSKNISGKRTYIVRQGDTAKSVARRAGISVTRLCQLNMIKDNEPLQIGRMLKLK